MTTLIRFEMHFGAAFLVRAIMLLNMKFAPLLDMPVFQGSTEWNFKTELGCNLCIETGARPRRSRGSGESECMCDSQSRNTGACAVGHQPPVRRRRKRSRAGRTDATAPAPGMGEGRIPDKWLGVVFGGKTRKAAWGWGDAPSPFWSFPTAGFQCGWFASRRFSSERASLAEKLNRAQEPDSQPTSRLGSRLHRHARAASPLSSLRDTTIPAGPSFREAQPAGGRGSTHRLAGRTNPPRPADRIGRAENSTVRPGRV